jgi:hypothetical protein
MTLQRLSGRSEFQLAFDTVTSLLHLVQVDGAEAVTDMGAVKMSTVGALEAVRKVPVKIAKHCAIAGTAVALASAETGVRAFTLQALKAAGTPNTDVVTINYDNQVVVRLEPGDSKTFSYPTPISVNLQLFAVLSASVVGDGVVGVEVPE